MTTLAVARGPRRVLSTLDDACRNMRVAQEVVSGRFTMAGTTLALGLEPDWRRDPCPADKEWRVDWVKFYYGLDLAHAFGVTRDRRYLQTWEDLVREFMAQRAPGSDETEVVARRIRNWIYAWNRFEAAAGQVEPSVAAAMVEYMWREVAFVRDHLSAERNHRTLELYALLVAAVAFPDRDREHALRTFAFDQLHANLLEDIRSDGVHREASIHYHCIALRSWLGAMEHARCLGVTLPPSYAARLSAACEFAAHAHRPDGCIPACSDADVTSYRDVLLRAAALFNRPDWRWVATLGREGTPPARGSASFPCGGYYTQRSGWGGDARAFGDERYLIFDCGPLGDGGHGHYDLLSVEVFALQQPLLVDPGRFTYSESGENWRRWFKGTAAHNTVLVDGRDQTPYARRKPKGPAAAGRLLARASAPGLDMLTGEASSPVYEATHTRTVLFVADEYWIVVDQLAGRRPHAYQLRWHLSPHAGAGLAVDAVQPGLVRARGVTLAFAPVRAVRVEPGWYAPQYGVRHPAPVVVVDAHAQTTSFVTVIDPRSSDTSRSPLRVGFVSCGDGPAGRSVLEVRGVGASGADSDLITWSTERNFLELAAFRGMARVAWTRRDAQDRALRFAAADVSDGTWRYRDRLEAIGPGGAPAMWVTWDAARALLTTGRSLA